MLANCAAALAKNPPAAPPRDPVLVTISKETTRITEPLKPSGYPDFLEAANLQAKGKVTPVTNGALLVLRALSPEDMTSAQAAEFYRRLEVQQPADDSPRLVDYSKFLESLPSKKFPPPNREERKIKNKNERLETIRGRLQLQHDDCSESPWQDQDHPLLAEWLGQQAGILQQLDKLRDYPQAYLPIVHGQNNSSLLYSKSPLNNVIRVLVDTLAIRGHRAIGAEQYDKAIDDFERLLILRGYLRQQHSIQACISSTSIGHFALHHLFRSIATSLKLSPQQIQRLQELLATHDQYEPILAKAIDKHERWIALDVYCRYAEFGIYGSKNETPEKLEYRKLYDYDLMLARTNQEYDRQRDLWLIKDSVERTKAANKLDIEQHQRDPILVFPLTKYIAFLTKEGRSKHLAEVHLVLTAPSAALVRDICDRRDNFRRAMWYCTIKLLQYRQIHGRFPEKLAKLPDASLSAPVDYQVWLESLSYQSDGMGFLLYSWDYDQIDQQGYRGKALNDDFCDDLAIFTAERRPKQPKIGYPPRSD